MTDILADNDFKCIFLNENDRILIQISLKFVPLGPIYNKSSLVQVMAWHHPGDRPLSEQMMIILLKHIWITRSQWADMAKLLSQHGKVKTCRVKCEMKLFIHSQTSKAAPLKYENKKYFHPTLHHGCNSLSMLFFFYFYFFNKSLDCMLQG